MSDRLPQAAALHYWPLEHPTKLCKGCRLVQLIWKTDVHAAARIGQRPRDGPPARRRT
jgi:hypothetical protein